MITLTPVPRALVPIDSDAAERISAPNYDEFQSDREIWEAIQANPDSVLSVTMAHCDAASPTELGRGDSPQSLARAAENMVRVISSPLTREVNHVLWVYEIVDPGRPGVRQIGLGGMARTDEIRTDRTPTAPVIRNEGIRPPKSRGRAQLIEATQGIIGTVNNAVDDASGILQATLERFADARDPDYEVGDPHGNKHRIWLIEDRAEIAELQALLAAEPHAYVADGNHRSAAAAMLGHEHYLAVFFVADTMGIAPYNRLVDNEGNSPLDLSKVETDFVISDAPGEAAFQPHARHDVGLYADGSWHRLVPREGTFDAASAAEVIDADIVQRNLFAKHLDIPGPGDPRLTFVGSNRDAAWLQQEVDRGAATYAVTLPAVTMEQFVEVCRQNRMMPPKSTWFEPKIRSGLVMAML